MRAVQLRSLGHRLRRRQRAPQNAPVDPTVAAPGATATPAPGATATPAPVGTATPVPVIAAPSVPARVALRVPDPRHPPGRVLLVTSDRRFRALASTLLSQRGYAVIVSRGSEDVSELAERERADVVLLDATASLTAVARQSARLGSLRTPVGVVAVSGESAGSLEALPVLAKWSSFDEVLSAVEHACRHTPCVTGEA
jgi:CheY-like chemotaxis protein